MRSQEVTVYREIQRNTETAMKAMETISDKVYDDNLARLISGQSLKYAELHNEAAKQLVEAKAELYRGSHLTDMMLKAGIHYNTMLNTSTGHIAELMIKGSNTGILEMEKVLHHNPEAGEKSTALARQLIDFQENSAEILKDYL